MSQKEQAEKRNGNWKVAFTKVQDFTIQRGVNSFINPFSLLKLGETNNVVNGIDHLYVDGISLVKFFNFFLKKSVSRYSFDDSSIAPVVFKFVKDNNLRIAVLGTTQENLEKSVGILEKRYDFKVSYSRNGFFAGESQRKEIIQLINQNEYDVVVCGMGTPLQEKFLIELKEAGWKGYGYTCGGYLHQLATKEKYYPKFFDKLNIRWIYRIYDEPKLFHRYFVLYPLFAFYFLIYCIKSN
ncbi:teichoic acid biosynthesis protein A [Adhaeribacter aerolatus]|uniref:Teichoic acid biosynthesis protein A n=1 Tax=Adhaeribacter aerolatus TaxID=670289 RepID=A0A512B222_9BACT|nr:WecB/TagA/CpsF family glycosyltransferase [Adhaeribacter aerolatus]GEO06000.1 teichoic acid biosynthesis protein A [Adhaeribacter aerolatus]